MPHQGSACLLMQLRGAGNRIVRGGRSTCILLVVLTLSAR